MPLDRRRPSHPRFPLRIPALAEPVGAVASPGAGETENLSRGGVGLRLERELVRGASVRVTLRFHRRPALTLRGTVAWVRPHPNLAGCDLGIQFSEELPGEMVVEIADEEHPPWISCP